MIDLDDISSATDLAHEHGVPVTAMIYWTSLPTFPAPLKRLSFGRIWSRAAVAEWVNARPVNPELGRKTGPRVTPTTKMDKVPGYRPRPRTETGQRTRVS